MDPHVSAIIDLLAAVRQPAHYLQVPHKPSFPYVLFWFDRGGAWGDQDRLCGEYDAFDDHVYVRPVALTVASLSIVKRNVFNALQDRTPTVPGRAAHALRYVPERALPDQEDRDVVIPESGARPLMATLAFRYITEPTGG